MEIAPTLAALLGVPVADDWPGRVATELLRPEYFSGHALASTPSWDGLEIQRRAASLGREQAEEDLSNLRGLGYIGEGVELDEDTRRGSYDFWSAGDQTLVHNLHTEVVYYLLQGEREAAESVLGELRARRPDLERALVNWVRIKYSGLERQLPEGYLDGEPFEAFLAGHRGAREASPAAAEEVDQ